MQGILDVAAERVLSIQALAESIQQDPRRISESVCALAGGIEHCCQHQLRLLLQYLLAKQRTGVLEMCHAVILRKYDETPLKLVLDWRDHTGDAASTKETKAKLMVVEREVVMCLWQPQHGGAYLNLRMPFPNLLRVADSMEGQVVKSIVAKAMDFCGDGTDLSQFFATVDEVSTTDEHASNGVCERRLQQEHDHHDCLHLVCDIHKCSAIAKKTFDLVPSFTSRLIHAAMFLQSSGAMQVFRQALCAEIEETTERCVGGGCDLEADTYRLHIFDVFLSRQRMKGQSCKRAMTELLNADIRVPAVVHHCHGCCQDRQALVNKIKRHIIGELAGSNIVVFPRSNSIGFVRGFGFRLTVALDEVQAPGAHLALAVDADADAVALANVIAEGGDEQELYRLESRCRQKVVQSWLSQRDLAQELLHQRRIIGPQALLMQELMKVSGKSFDRLQQSCWLATEQENFRLCHTHEAVHVKKFFKHVRDLFAELWLGLHITVATMSSVFRQLARSAAVAFKLLYSRHVKAPYLTFKLLFSDDVADDLLNPRPCLQDPWTARFLAKVRTREQLVSLEARRRLQAIARYAAVDTFSTERVHSSNLRRAKSRNQTHIMSLAELAARSTIGFVTGHSKATGLKRKTPELAHDEEQEVEQHKFKKTGAWRAFLAYHCQSGMTREGKRFNPEQLAGLRARYVLLSDDEKKYYVQLAECMDSAKAARGGKRRRHTKRQRQQRLLSAQTLALAARVETPTRGLYLQHALVGRR
eukprot:2127253-Amphidinium_carterae.1